MRERDSIALCDVSDLLMLLVDGVFFQQFLQLL